MKKPKMRKVLHPPGTKVVYGYDHYGRSSRHCNHVCVVVESHVKLATDSTRGRRNIYKYTLRDLEETNPRFQVFKTEDRPPENSVSLKSDVDELRRAIGATLLRVVKS